MGLPTVSVKRPVLIWVIFAALILLGGISFFLLPVELYQGSSRGIISIIIRARGGLPPVEVERMITHPVEEAVSTVSHLKTMYSNSREAESRVTLEFEPGVDMKFAGLEVREKFSRVKGILPSEIEKPVIANFEDSDSAVLIFAVTSPNLAPEKIREIVDHELKPRLDRVNGVASVEVYGGRERKILVELDRDKMFSYNISVERVMDVIGASNIALLAGSQERGAYDFAIRTMGAFTSIDQIGNLGIKGTRQGSIIPLKEIATIKDSYMEPEDFARLNLNQNVSVYVKKSSLANTIKVVDELKKIIDHFTKERSGGDVGATMVSDKAKLIKRAINDVWTSLYLAVLFVAAIVYFALRRWVLSLIVLTTIPISIISTFIFMAAFKLSLNVMTLSGLALSIGIIVDSAIVVIENTVKKREEGLSQVEAAVEGAEEVWLPLLASLMTHLCVFLPIIFIDKQIQLTYQGFAITVSIALAMSLIIAVMLVPMLLSVISSENSHEKSADIKKRDTIFERTKRGYDKWARFSLKHRYSLLLVITILFVFSSWRLAVRHIDLPSQLEENEFAVVVFPLAGAKLEANDEVAKRLEGLLHGFKEVEMLSTTVQKNDLRLFVRLAPRQKRKTSKEVIMNQIREKGNELIKQIHDEYSLIVDEGVSSEESKKLVVNIFGLENDTLEKLAHQVAQKINSINGLTNLVMTDLRKRPEYSIVVDKGRSAFYGFTVHDIADSIHALVRGMRPTKFHEVEKGEEIEMITRLQPIFRQKVEDLQDLYVVSPKNGTQIALKQIAGIYPSRGPQTIDRKDKYRYVFVKGDVLKPLQTVAEEVKAAMKGIEMPKDYFWRFGGRYEELLKGKSQLGVGVLLSVVLVYMVLACLYQSYVEPLMIMVAIPLATIGVWAALFFTRKPLSEQVFIAMFILIGTVVNSSIILVDRVNHLRIKIPSTTECLIQAAKDRLRPVLATAGSTVIGFIPMAIDQGESSQLWAPLAITMIGGILSSTMLTLFVIPMIYLVFEDLKALLQKLTASKWFGTFQFIRKSQKPLDLL